MRKIRRFRKGQYFRVVIDGIHFFTTAAQIRRGVGDEYTTNSSIQKALDILEVNRSTYGTETSTGLAGRWDDHMVQLDIMNPKQAI